MNKLFPVVILAGGLATRLRPLTTTIPKALIDVNGEPFIAHQLRLLKAKGISQVVICVGYLGEQIVEYINDGKQFGLDVKYSFDGEKLLGTAGAIKKALSLLGETFFILYGDSYLTCDYARVQKAFLNSDAPALMTVYKNEGRWDTSNIIFKDGLIKAYDKLHKNSEMQYIDYGLGMSHASIFAQLPAMEYFDLADFYKLLLHKQQLAGFEVSQRFYEIGSFAGIEAVSQFLLEQHSKEKTL